MYIIKNAIYARNGARRDAGYVKCVLHKSMAVEPPRYYLVETKVVLDMLPQHYEVVTMNEVIAKYGNEAVLDTFGKEA